jgi:hypothetical protein
MALTQFADSPRNGGLGDRPYALLELVGPTSYTQVAVGVAPAGPTGGQAITPASFGLTAGLEAVIPAAGSTTGTYYVRIFQQTNYLTAQGNPAWLVQWFNASTGAEVAAATNLSAETVRLLGIGPY